MQRAWVVVAGIVILSVILPQPAFASDISVTCSETAPTESDSLLASHPFSLSNFTWNVNWVGDLGWPDWEHTDLGQSFLISAPDDVWMDKVTVKIGWNGYGGAAPGADYRLELWTVTDWFDWSGNTLIETQYGTLPTSGLLGAHSYWTFDIENVKLITDQYYAFILAFEDGPVAGRYVGFAHTYGPPNYVDGRMIYRTGTPPVWHPGKGHDLEFYVHGAVVVDIDIKPGSDPNSINLGSGGVVPVAILGSETFDVAQIDQTTLAFQGSSASTKGKSGKIGAFDDLNGDGYMDLVVQFPTEDLALTQDDSEATVTGELTDGTPIRGTDSIRVVPPEE